MRRATALAVVLALAASVAAAADQRPDLVVVVVVDMLPAGKLEQAREHLSGGFRRLLDGGRRFTRCSHAHALTETGPGHAALLSGLLPRHNGIVANDWYDRALRRDVYCAGDDRPDAPPNFDRTPAVSAAHLKGENLADLVKRAHPAARVYAVAGKDRSAILTGGHRADGVFWFSAKMGGFTSGPAFMTRLPSWDVEVWAGGAATGDLYLKNVPATWIHPVRPGWGPDDYPYESPIYSRTSPHPVASTDARAESDKRASAIARQVFFSPWVDWMTLNLAGRIVQEADLGGDGVADLLVVGLSGMDAIGHAYGPDSQEYLDALVRVDAWLGDFMAATERRGRTLFALSSDHGTLPLPETVAGARRVDEEAIRRKLEAGLASRLGDPGEGRFIEAVQGGNYFLDRSVLERLRVPLAKAVETARAELSGYWEVARVYRSSDLATIAPGAAPPSGDLYLDLYRNAYDPSRSGDLVVQPCEKCLFTNRPEGTSHGSPYGYDRDVPIILLGAGIAPGEDARACRTVDLAPTLAERLGLSFDAPRDGASLLGPPAVDRTGGRK